MANEDEVTLLFEQNSIAQVQEILNKTRADIECKKEDLRIMVGERYRDLIEAADTIAEMQSSAEAICENIETMEGLCGSLHQRGLIGFKTQTQHNNNAHQHAPGGSSHYSIAVCVRILVGAPETLWSLTERGQHLQATQLLLLALHTHTALHLASTSSQVTSWFPVIERQWINITQFRSTIVRGCSTLISSEVDDIESVLDAVVSVMLVEGCSTAEALSLVLQLRHSALTAALQPRPSATARTQIATFTTLLLASLTIVQALFVDCGEGGESRVERRVEEVVEEGGGGEGEEELTPISLLGESSLTLSFLPHSIRNFRPSLQGSRKSLDKELVRRELETWLEKVLEEASQSLNTLLAFTTSVKALGMIRTSVWEVCRERLTPQLSDKSDGSVCGGGVSSWLSVVREAVTGRARAVVSGQLSAAREATLQMLATLSQDITQNHKVCSDEGDVSSFVWCEAVGDLPHRVGWTPAATRPLSQAGGLYHKTRGFTGRLQGICRGLNSRLSALLQDVAHFSPDGGSKEGVLLVVSESSVVEERSAKKDHQALLIFLQDASCNTFTQMVKDIEEATKKQFSSLDHNLSHDDDEGISSHSNPWCEPPMAVGVVVVVAAWRLCLALTTVCQQMQLCASAASLTNPDFARRASLGTKMESESWGGVRGTLLEASGRLFKLLVTSLTSMLYTQLHKALSTHLNGGLEASLAIFPTWEVVEIDEEGEGGRVVSSSIRVPGHPTPTLTHCLAHLCSHINKLAAHTIARGNQSVVSEAVCESVVSAYMTTLTTTTDTTTIAENTTIDTTTPTTIIDTISQTLALQLIFDLRFIQMLLLPRDNKVAGGEVASLIQKLESRVDPFDLDVFSPHLSTRVRQAAHRAQVLLGVVLPRDRSALSGRVTTTTTGTTSSTSVSNNNALPIILPVEIPRFSNVPLPVSSSKPPSSSLPSSASTPSLSTTLADHTMRKQGSPRDSSSPGSTRREVSSAALSASRSAASLFSAMSSSWFGSSSNS